MRERERERQRERERERERQSTTGRDFEIERIKDSLRKEREIKEKE